ncbi:hypothetical protein ABMA27_010035 [Loxostege sticticalis]|uniref:Protein FAR1-RELATED SEQUENCE n=1 Tax=Loxostege sticticalis TaxID=481309 RepID=A0ABR3H7B7_LOXSC
MYHKWIRRSVERTGKPAVTRLGPNHVILRRSLANVQRYGLCDEEERKFLLYTDETTVDVGRSGGMRKVKYNMTLFASVDYSCIVFRAINFDTADRAPRLRLKRWCAGTPRTCSGFQHLEIDFYVEVTFTGKMQFTMKAYGRKAVAIDVKRAMKYLNRYLEHPPILSQAAIDKTLMRVRPFLADIPQVATTTTTSTTTTTTTTTTTSTTTENDNIYGNKSFDHSGPPDLYL